MSGFATSWMAEHHEAWRALPFDRVIDAYRKYPEVSTRMMPPDLYERVQEYLAAKEAERRLVPWVECAECYGRGWRYHPGDDCKRCEGSGRLFE